MNRNLRRELVIALVLLAFGLIALPAAVFWVGRHAVGTYGDGGVWDLTRAIWLSLLQGEVAAWVLVSSPYVVVQLLRLTHVVWRARKAVDPVNDVTISNHERRRL